MLYKISEFDFETLSISSSKDATYVQSNKQPFELQVDWITLGKYPLPSKKFVTDGSKSLNLTVRINVNDENYKMLSEFDNIHSNLDIAHYKKYHPLVSAKDN